MDTPQKIYKYESFNTDSIVNLKNQVIYFSSPMRFNDPYDCAITASIKELSDDDVILIKDAISKRASLTPEMRKVLGATDINFFRKFILSFTDKMVNDHKKKFLENRGISCFSERKDDLLMWSHYADRCTGFCLEFNTDCEVFSKLRKVYYSDKIPQIDPVKMLVHKDYEQIIDLYCLKSLQWKYEKEWRCLHTTAGTEFVYEPSALKAIYFGPDINPAKLEILCLILQSQNPDVKLFRGKRRSDQFSVEFSHFEYIPHIVGKTLGLDGKNM